MSLVIDSHNHIGDRHGMSQTGAELVAKLDAAGVDKAVIMPFVEGTIDNDPVAAEATAYPDRLIYFCAVNPWDRTKAVDEVRRCAEVHGARGVKLHPTLHGYRLADHGLTDPIFAAAADLGLVVTSHGASDLNNTPHEFAEMARTHPDVTLWMVHMGFFWMTDLASEMAARHPNLYLDTSRAPILEIAVAVEKAGPEKVLWGTDSPFVDYTGEFRKMERVAATREGYELVVGGNVARLLGITA